MTSPSSPRSSVPIPSTTSTGSKSRRSSRVFQSSLEIAISYSRSQQRQYGYIRSAPSFVDVSSPEDNDLEEGGEDLWDDTIEPADDIDAEGAGRRYSGSPSGGLFTSDPFRSSPPDHDPQQTRSVSSTTFPQPQSSIQRQGQGQSTERTPLLARIPSTSTSTSVKTRIPSVVKDHPRRLSFAPDGIGVGLDRTKSPESPKLDGPRRRSSAGVTRRRRHHDVGESTNGQTLFNAIAVLVGIGLLSLPLAFAYAGWIGGTFLLLGFAYITCYTAKLLARLILTDRSLMGYTDIGKRAFGGWASGAINVLFCLELFALSVALVVLFGDTLSAIFPSISANTFKFLGFFIVLPTTLLPLHLLSLPSLLSTLSSLLLVLVLLLDGFIKQSSPGSILHPGPTNLTPEWTSGNWLGGVGLVLAGFGGHAVVPGLARDMKYPECFDKVINRAFVIATGISFVAGSAGYLMIGNGVSDEITRDLLEPKFGYPRLLNLFALWMIVINPVTKFGLCTRPLNVTIESLLDINPSTPGDESQIFTSGLSHTHEDEDSPTAPLVSSNTTVPTTPGDNTSSSPSPPPTNSVKPRSRSKSRPNPAKWTSSDTRTYTADSEGSKMRSWTWLERRKTAYRVISRVGTTAVCVGTAIALPGFGKVMAFLGSFSAFLICIILPLLFHIRLAPRLLPSDPTSTPTSNKIHWLLVGLSTAMMVAGTGWAFIPGSGHGGLDDGRV